MKQRFLAIGGAHWDILGRAPINMALHDDVGGRIRRLIGGVAGPIAMKLGRAGANIDLICYAGHDELGDALLTKLAEYNVGTKHAIRGTHPTDVYMGIEAPNGLIAAIADCHSLEAVSDEAVSKLFELSDAQTHVIIDGNLHEDALAKIAKQDFEFAAMTLIPASPGKIMRFTHFCGEKPAQLIVNLREACSLTKQDHAHSADAAHALTQMGFSAALVSNGGDEASFANTSSVISALPPQVEVKRFTGAGDTLSGHFLWATSANASPEDALSHALRATSQFISCEDLDA